MGIIVDIILPLSLAFIMFSLGLGLSFEDFSRVVRQPKDFAVGAFSQMILLPVVAFLFASLWPLAPELSLGLMIIAAAPGGATSNIITAFARGDVALSISLTAIISLLSVITIPLIVVFSHGQFMGEQAEKDISVAGTAIGVFVIVTVPVLMGLLVRRLATNFALRIKPAARSLSVILFALVLAGAIYQERSHIIPYFSQTGLVTLAFNVSMMMVAYLLAKFFATGRKQQTSIVIECGLQNGTLAIAVAVLLFDDGLVVVPATTYSLLMFATSLMYVAATRRKKK